MLQLGVSARYEPEENQGIERSANDPTALMKRKRWRPTGRIERIASSSDIEDNVHVATAVESLMPASQYMSIQSAKELNANELANMTSSARLRQIMAVYKRTATDIATGLHQIHHQNKPIPFHGINVAEP